jgi:hypothetical protein
MTKHVKSQALQYFSKIYYMTPRFNAIRRFDYTVQGEPIEPKPELTLQTYSYTLDKGYHRFPNDHGQNCVLDPACLADVNIFKYRNDNFGK